MGSKSRVTSSAEAAVVDENVTSFVEVFNVAPLNAVTDVPAPPVTETLLLLPPTVENVN